MVWYEYAYWTLFIVCRCPSNSFVKWAGLVGVPCPSFEDGDSHIQNVVYTVSPTNIVQGTSSHHSVVCFLWVFFFFVNFPDIFNLISFY
jgi:hypothetical protein